MKLGPSGSLVIDPAILGTQLFQYPGESLLMGRLTDEIYDLMFEMHSKERSTFTSLVLARNRIAGVVSIALANLNAIRKIQENPVQGFSIDHTAPALEFFEERIDLGSYSGLGRWKAQAALCLQGGALKIIDLLRIPRPIFQLSNETPEPSLRDRWFWRIRGFPLLLGRARDLTTEEWGELNSFTSRLTDRILALQAKHDIPITESERKKISAYLNREMTIAYIDYMNLRDWFSGGRTDFFGGSVSGYGRALLALVARESGGAAHGTVHGGNVFANSLAANVFEFVNASVSWVPSEPARRNGIEMMRLRCPTIEPCEIRVHEHNELIRYLRKGEAGEPIRTVLVMGVQVVLQVAGLSVLPAPCYVDVEKRLTASLLAAGYDVIYKPHPENSWRGYKAIFDSRVSIETGPYEKMDRPFEAVVYVHPFSSTFISDIGSSRHIVLINDGWHDSFWLPSSFSLIERRCEMVAGRIDERGRIDFDSSELLAKLKDPKCVDPSLFADYIGVTVSA